MTVRRTTALVLVAASLVACGSGEPAAAPDDTTSPAASPSVPGAPGSSPTTAPAPTTSPSPTPSAEALARDGLVTALGETCSGIDGAPPRSAPELTFVRDGRLYAVSATGGEARCLLEARSGAVAWAPAADRLLDGPGAVVAPADAPSLTLVGSGGSYTRPTGSSVIAIEDDGRSLVKTELATGERTEVSFLGDHDEVTYYPSGTHLLAIGADGAETYGIWLATNQGAETQLLAEGPEGATLHDLRVSDDGRHILFVADHGSEQHVHRAQLLGESLAGGTDEAQAETLATSGDPIGALTIDASGLAVAATLGDCRTRPRRLVAETASGDDLASAAPEGDAVPIGWLSDDTLLVATVRGGCVGTEPADLWLLSPGDDPQLVVDAVGSAAVRRTAEDAPPPPVEGFSGFA